MVSLADMIVCLCTVNNFLLVFALGVIQSCTNSKNPDKETLPYYNSAQFEAEWIPLTSASYPKIHQIADFSLQDQSGRTITKDSLTGYIYVANFFFTSCPKICPNMTANLYTLQKNFLHNAQIKIVSFSVMPWVDSVSRLKDYALAYDIHPNKWHLLTGNKEQIYELGRKSYFIEKGLGLQKESSEFLHTETMVLIDKKGRIRGIYNATQKVDIERVSEDIGILLKEKG